MTRTIAMLMLGVLVGLPSCATSDESGLDAAGARVVITNRAGNVRLTFAAGGEGSLQLQAFGEELFGASAGALMLSQLWIDGRAVSGSTTSVFQIDAPVSGGEWQYSGVKFPATNIAGLKLSQRRFLCIEPDLVVVLDEVSLDEPCIVETGYWFPSGLAHDAVRDEWKVQTPRAGVTARFLASPKSKQARWNAVERQTGSSITNSALECVRSTAAEKVREFYQLTVLMVHPEQSRRSLSFKLLESDTAIGVRVHRDGLPTLVAFRKANCAGEANLTGMKFNGPVAVDVFHPKKR